MRSRGARRLVGLSAALALGAVSVGLTSCATTESSSETLRVWWYEGDDSAQGRAWTEALEAFRAENPDVEVEFELKTWDQMMKSGQMILNSDEAPDLLEYPKGNATAGAVAKAGLLTNLTDVAAERGWSERLPDSLLSVGRYDERGLMGTGDLYGVPTYAEYVAVFYNKDLLAERGLEPPATIEEFEQQLAAFTADGITPLALGAADAPIVHLVYQLALSRADQQWVRDFQFFEGDTDFHDDAWSFAAETVADWKAKGYISADATGIDGDAAAEAFKSGASPYFVTGTWFSGDFDASIESFDWGTFPIPGSGLAQGSGGNVWVVPAASEHKDLAYDFIDRLLDEESQTAVANYGGVAVAANLDEVTNPVGQLVADDLAAILENDGLGFYPDWPVPGYYDVWLAQSQNLVNGTVTPTEYLDNLAAFYERGRTELGL